MRLVIRKEGEPAQEITLRGDRILVGENPERCNFWLARDEWPMVAEVHAEFRSVSGVCYLFDRSGDAGTWLDNKQITQSAPVRSGSRIRFGANGPEVTVLLVETVDSVPAPPLERQDDGPRIMLPSADRSKSPTSKPAHVEVVSNDAVNLTRLDLVKNVVQFGRAPGLDLVFDVDACFISRRHAEIRRTPDGYLLNDLNSFNGTLLNEKRLTGPSLLRSGDTIQLGLRGPVLRFHQTGLRLSGRSPLGITPEPPRELALTTTQVQPPRRLPPKAEVEDREPVFVVPLNVGATYSIGRSARSDIKLDGLQISKNHARLVVALNEIFVEDTDSTNGVYVNGVRLMRTRSVGPHDMIQIGPFLLCAGLTRGLEVFDTRARMRLDSIALTKVVPSDVNKSTIKLLDEISLTIQPNEFIGLLGPSGAGKSTLVDALCGMRPATAGQVLVNNLDLYENLEWLKQSIGYVPQDDIIHRELTVYQTLYFVAKLRLSEDVSDTEIDIIIGEVLDVTGLSERRELQVDRLSGGQRKRISMAVELITKPSAIFLDEPTSGLDPTTEEKIMILFRQIADSGHTVILTTHAMENVKLFDKIIVLMHGKLVFYGTPRESLGYFNAKSFKELYDKLEEPIVEQLAGLSVSPDAEHEHYNMRAALVREKVAEGWKQKFQLTDQFAQNVYEPQRNLRRQKPARRPTKRARNFKNFLRQSKVLCSRYSQVMKRDRMNLRMLFGQALVIACLTWLAVAPYSPRDFPYFIMALVPIWFGTSVAARELIRERAIYRRERMVNLGVWPYVTSKLMILTMIVSLQCLILFSTLKLFAAFDLIKLAGTLGGFPQLVIMMLTGLVGVSLGLFVSSWVKTSEMATTLVPLLLIPQILFSGLIGVPKGASKAAGVVMPVTWSFDEIKRLSASNVRVLEGKDEGAEPAFNNEGRGLYKQNQFETERTIKTSQRRMDKKGEAAVGSRQPGGTRRSSSPPEGMRSEPADENANSLPEKLNVSYVPDDLSDFVSFLHPWGSIWLNPVMLLLMFLALLGATIQTLRTQDSRYRTLA